MAAVLTNISPTHSQYSGSGSAANTPRSSTGSGRISPISRTKKEGVQLKPGQHVKLTYTATAKTIEIIFIERILEPGALRGYLPGDFTKSQDFLLNGVKIEALSAHTALPALDTCVIL